MKRSVKKIIKKPVKRVVKKVTKKGPRRGRPTREQMALKNQYILTADEKLLTLRMGVVAVIKKHCTARTILGSPGCGKSYSVVGELSAFESRFVTVTGGIKNHMALYAFLYANNDPNLIIVFDDCNDILRDKKCREILRRAVDPAEDREIIMLDTKKNLKNIGAPKTFIFKSRILIISNLLKKKIDDAIISRTSPIEVFLTPQELFYVVKENAHGAQPVNVAYKYKQDVLEFIENDLGVHNLKKMCFRQFKDCVLWRAAADNYDDKHIWKKQVYATLCQ